MLSVGGALAIFAGGGGLVLSQVGNLVPSRRDFMSALKLRKAQCVEDCAASHCFLLRQFMAAGVEDFDNVMRGDGRTSRDYFLEYTKVSIASHHAIESLSRAELYFRLCHFALLASTIGLLILGLLVSVSDAAIPFGVSVGVGLFAVELVAIFSLYALGDSNEGN